jgi:LL-diaminopimelate aminotransferase
MARLDRLPPYLFAEIDAACERARAAGVDVIDLGVGDPDRPTPAKLVEVAQIALKDPENHRYPANSGTKRLREAIARYMRRRFGVEVDAEREVVALLGSKEGIAHLPLAVTDPGDAILVPDPGYPVYTQGAVLAGVTPIPFPLTADRAFLPDPAQVEALATDKVRLLWLNYPNNPTGAEAGAGLLRPLVNLAARRGWILANDAAYVEMSLDGHRPVSLLEAVDHRQQRVIEFHSLSKTFNMTGWRLGFAVGHPAVVGSLARAKLTIDSGPFGAVQEVATFALGDVCEELLAACVRPYPRRRQVIVEALTAAGIEVFATAATFYIWARVPTPETSMAFCARLLKSIGVVATPGVGFGAGGEGWFRLSLTAPDARIDAAAERLRGL